MLYGAPVADMETCYKLMPRELMLSLDLQPSQFQIEPEITAKLLRRGYRIHEVPIWYQPRETHAKKLSAWRARAVMQAAEELPDSDHSAIPQGGHVVHRIA